MSSRWKGGVYKKRGQGTDEGVPEWNASGVREYKMMCVGPTLTTTEMLSLFFINFLFFFLLSESAAALPLSFLTPLFIVINYIILVLVFVMT